MTERSSRFLPGLFAFLALLYAIVIFSLSSLSGEDIPALPPTAPQADKLAHFALYAGFGVVLYLAFSQMRQEKITDNAITLTLVVGTVYGITDEVHQYFVPGRSMDIVDVLVDFLAILAAVGIIVLVKKMRQSE
ncbi:MAG: VanZ family protein [Methanomassiliicoccales archaeon]|nr:MAG: VanZ family protein [Methanomassiliicoccales archaeon]